MDNLELPLPRRLELHDLAVGEWLRLQQLKGRSCCSSTPGTNGLKVQYWSRADDSGGRI